MERLLKQYEGSDFDDYVNKYRLKIFILIESDTNQVLRLLNCLIEDCEVTSIQDLYETPIGYFKRCRHVGPTTLKQIELLKQKLDEVLGPYKREL